MAIEEPKDQIMGKTWEGKRYPYGYGVIIVPASVFNQEYMERNRLSICSIQGDVYYVNGKTIHEFKE